MSTSATKGLFHGEEAIWLKAGPYEAALLPNTGGNLIAFRDTEKGYRFLHEPEASEMEAFKAFPVIHGIPVLYPPNRFEDGKFPWNGRIHQFPVNEPETNNHLHGFVYGIPWEVEDFGSTKTESYVTVSLTVDEGHSVYEHLPYPAVFRLTYRLGADGLFQHFSVRNTGTEKLPCLFAFHTAINAPFVPGSTEADCLLKLTLGKRWELNERMLPTGKFQELTPAEIRLRDSGINPFESQMDNHYITEPRNGRNRAELTDTRAGVTLVYDAGTSWKHWMIWNNFNRGVFFCPEPQMNLVNAPNVDLPAEEIGLIGLEPGEIWEETGRLYVK